MRNREIVLDTETTGLSSEFGHRVIEIGAVELIDKVPTGRKFHSYLNPMRSVSEGAYKVHGISEEFLLDKPQFLHIAEEFLEFIQDSSLVIHNAPFDMKFLNYELSIVGMNSISHDRAIDTLSIARKLFPGSKVSLDALCRRFKIDLSQRVLHGALKDAELLMLVYIEMVGKEQISLSFEAAKGLQEARKRLGLNGDGVEKQGSFCVVKPSNNELKSHSALLAKIPNSIWSRLEAHKP
jgi:DNA polymerase III subunit epsilon